MEKRRIARRSKSSHSDALSEDNSSVVSPDSARKVKQCKRNISTKLCKIVRRRRRLRDFINRELSSSEDSEDSSYDPTSSDNVSTTSSSSYTSTEDEMCSDYSSGSYVHSSTASERSTETTNDDTSGDSESGSTASSENDTGSESDSGKAVARRLPSTSSSSSCSCCSSSDYAHSCSDSY